MNPEQQKAILAIALHAAFADGDKHDREREELRRIAESLAGAVGASDLSRLYQDVLLKRVTLQAAATSLTDPSLRQLAYEMAVCICDADGHHSDVEQRFLVELKTQLKPEAGQASAFERQAKAVVEASEATAPGVSMAAAGPVVAAHPNVSDAALNKSILNYALMNGALELLPQSWASLAIIPLQVRMVYGVGQAYGVTLDQGHIKEFIAAAGVGLTSQYLEQFGRKLLGGLLGKGAGKTFGSLGSATTGMAFSFATTYALGQLAKRHYAGGRVMTTRVLRETFNELVGPARQIQAQYLPQIQQQAMTLDMGRVMSVVRGDNVL